VRQKADAIAAAMSCPSDRADRADPSETSVGTARDEPKRPTFREIAEEAWWHAHRLPPDMEPGLSATVVYTPGGTIPVPDEHGHLNFDETYGAHMTAAAVEVDPVTGQVMVLDAVLVSDCGTVINPMVVEGQHQGAFVQGVGAVLLEAIDYDTTDAVGMPLVTTMRDYTVPTAAEAPVLRVVHRQTPSRTAGGFRGVGEAGIIAAPAVLTGAVADALAPLGVRITSTRLHPSNLRRLLRRAGYTPDPAHFARR
jgi:aerobic carbon-monoxide dehydrogenase large subunit